MFTLHNGDCLTVLPSIPSGSIDAIITDLPYGTTACAWDSIIPFAPMWEQVKRVLKPNGVFVTTASQPFTSALIMSNPSWFKYEWIWKKTRFTGNLNAKIMPLKAHENILVFSNRTAVYYPIKTNAPDYLIDKRKNINPSIVKDGGAYNGSKGFVNIREKDGGTRYPTTVLEYKNPNNEGFHPTQKPVDLYRYLIRTYTNPNETVLDITMGSGTTGVACVQEGREFIGIEKELSYFSIAESRLKEAVLQPSLFTPSNNRLQWTGGDSPALPGFSTPEV